MKTFTSSRMGNLLFLLKSRLFVAVLFCLLVLKMNGQVANYTFSESSGTYTNITGATAIPSGWDDNVTANTIPIGFSFNFNGTNYTTCSINSNGFITFGTTVSATNLFTPISSTTGYAGAISALGFDLISNSSTVVYITTGVAPNRTFIVQWNNARRYSGGSINGDFNFQIRLNETSNIITIVYGSCTPATNNVYPVQVGLRGAINTDFNNRSLTTNSIWDGNTSSGTTNDATCRTRSNARPNDGRTFTWAPPIVIASSAALPICSGLPTTLTASSTADYTYSWSPATGLNSTTGSSVIATPTTTTTYTVTGTRGAITTTKTIVVNVNPSPSNISLTQTVSPIGASSCDIDYVKLDATGGIVSNAVLYAEDFSAGVATNWAYGGTDTRVKGYYFNSNNAGGAIPEAGLAADGGIWVNTTGTYVFQPYNLLTNTNIPVNTLNYTTLSLSFKYRLEVFAPLLYNSSIYVDVSTNNVNWTNVWSNVDVGANVTANVTVNLNSYISNNQLYFRFRYTGDSYGLNTWYFDDVNIIGDKREISWSPSVGLFTDAALTNAYLSGTYANTVYAAPDFSTNFVASSIIGTCSKTATTSSIIRTKKVFTGLDAANPTFWNQTENWTTKTLPTSDKCVVIPTGKTVVVNVPTAAAKSVTVNDGGQLTIASNQALTIQDELINNNTGTTAADKVVVASDGNLIQINPSKTINSGSITAERNVTLRYSPTAPVPAVDFVYWGSPVTGQQTKGAGGFSPGTLNSQFADYRESNDRFYETADGNFIPGKGYSVQAERNKGASYNETYKFKGTPNNGDFTKALAKSPNSANGTVHGYNLVSNPYPSNISFEELYTANSGLIWNTAWFWTNATYQQYQSGSTYSGNNYAIYNGTGGVPATSPYSGSIIPNGIVKVGQGFIVQAKVAGNLQFKNSYSAGHDLRVSNSGTFVYKQGNEKNRYWLKLIASSTLVNSQLIGYVQGATNDFEQDYDAEVLGLSSDLFYSIIPNKKLLIQGRTSDFMIQDKVDLGANFFQTGNYTIELGGTEGIFANGQNIYLKDKQTGIITDLTQGAYTFTASSGETNARFEIIYEPETVLATDTTSKEKLVVYRENGDFVIKSPKEMERVEVYGTSGKLIKILLPNSKSAILESATLVNGMYILKIKTKDSAMATKKILK